MSKVLVISPDAVPVAGVLAAGPGIRYWQISLSLAQDYGHDVTLAVPEADLPPVDAEQGVGLVGWNLNDIVEQAGRHDCVIMPHVHSGLSTVYRRDADPDLPTAVDLYDPVLIENIGLQPADESGARSFAGYLAGVVPLLKRGDFFVYANERQRYYYLGALNVLGRINPLTYGANLLQPVPFGVDRRPPVKTAPAMRGKFVDQDDKVILWFSGIYPWFDAYTLVEAMPMVVEAIPGAKLVIMGGVHPRGHAPDGEYKRTKARVEELGIKDRHVFFTDWQPYAHRANWYLEADLAVATHKQSLETELSHRTRVIDFLWGGLPTITSAGDAVGSWLESRGCGRTVPVGDKDSLAEAIVAILRDDAGRAAMSEKARALAASELVWKKVVEPLARFCADPKIAPDRRDQAMKDLFSVIDTADEHRRQAQGRERTKGVWARAADVYREEGLPALLERTRAALVRRLRGERV